MIMENIFLTILNMSITASFLVLAIVLLRLLLKKAPRFIMCLLWILVAVRLMCPFSFESILSLIPSAEPVPPEIIYADISDIGTGMEIPSDAENNIIYNTNVPESMSHMTNMQVITLAASILWIVGIIGMLIYALISYLRIRRRVRISMLTEDNIYLCDHIDTPFILGIFKPRIYLPSTLSDRDAEYVIAHEKAHLKRRDHLWKPLGFLLLSVYWFNPILWLAYILLCRDIELACDEKVIKEMGEEYKKDYSSALLSCSVPRKMISACPLAFGETDVKRRIKTVLNYKKPAFWIIIVAIITCIAVAVCFLTNPISNNPYGVTVTKSGSDYEGLSVELKELELTGENPYIDIKWKNKTDKDFTCGESFTIYKVIEDEYLEDCRDGDHIVFAIGYRIPAHGSFRHEYGLSGLDISEPGTYRFVSDCSVNGGEYKNYDVWVEFEIKEIPSDDPADSNNSGSTVEGISAELVSLNLSDESSPYIEIKWTNKTDRERISGEEFHIYKDTDGELIDCRTGVYSLEDIGYIIPAKGYFTNKYSLYNIDLSEAGKYRFEAPFSGGKEKVWIEFEIGENGNLIEDPDKEVSVIYYYEDAEEVYKPHLRLSTKDNRFEFTLSGLSSYNPMGTYKTKDGVMTLTADDGNRYVFNVIDDDTLEFVADKSADIPKYRYSSDEKAKHPFPDGAHFELGTTEDHDYYSTGRIPPAVYGSIKTDIDGDGDIDELRMTCGPTTDVFTFTVTVTENGGSTYSSTFTSVYYDLSFVQDESGKIYIHGLTQGDNPTSHIFSITVKDETIILNNDSNAPTLWTHSVSNDLMYADSIESDLDGDGKDELFTIERVSSDSSKLSFIIRVSENGRVEHYNIFTTDQYYDRLSFADGIGGGVDVVARSNGEDNVSVLDVFSLSVEDGILVLTEENGDRVYYGAPVETESDDGPTLIRQTGTSEHFPQELPYSYNEIIEMTVKAFPWERGNSSAAIADLPASSYMYRRHSDLSEIGYALIDLDNNGQQELVIAPVDGTYVYDLYTIKKGKTVQLFSSGERYTHSLYENGYISLSWSGGAALSGHDFFKLTDSKLKFLERVTTDVFYAEEIGRIEKYTDAGSDNTFFRSNSEKTKDYVSISDKEALKIIDSYKNPEKELRIKYTPLSEYNT